MRRVGVLGPFIAKTVCLAIGATKTLQKETHLLFSNCEFKPSSNLISNRKSSQEVLQVPTTWLILLFLLASMEKPTSFGSQNHLKAKDKNPTPEAQEKFIKLTEVGAGEFAFGWFLVSLCVIFLWVFFCKHIVIHYILYIIYYILYNVRKKHFNMSPEWIFTRRTNKKKEKCTWLDEIPPKNTVDGSEIQLTSWGW